MKKSDISSRLTSSVAALKVRGVAVAAVIQRDWRHIVQHGSRLSLYSFSAVGLLAVAASFALWVKPTWRTDLAARVSPVLEVASGQANAAIAPKVESSAAPDSALMAQAAQHVPSAAVLAAYIPNTRVAPEARDSRVLLDTREQVLVADFLARRYRVAGDVTSNLVRAAYSTGKEVGLDPLLLLAVMAIESGFNPYAESTVGAQGLMQVMSKVHRDKLAHFGGQEAALHPLANIKVGALILKECIARGGSLPAGLRRYVGSTSVGDGGYGAKVMAERDRLRNVLKGHRVSITEPQAPVIVSSAKSVTPAKSSDAGATISMVPTETSGKAAANHLHEDADEESAA